ncbi:uncharacterized protein [Dermacentor albipictus]|uniref:uncharacterized protein isoform X1 n=1 Tax=Dermacentor albipictus TaxID=60249 RepID=UPI0038FCE648
MPSGGPSYGSYCCVTWCFNNGRTQEKPGTNFFRIPWDGRMTAWMQYAGRYDLLSKPGSLLYATLKAGSLSVASTSDCHMTAEAALQGSAEEPSNSDLHTLRCPDEQGGNSLVAGKGASADLGLLKKTLTNRSVVTEGTSVIGTLQQSSDSSVRGAEQASQDSLEDVSANSSMNECPTANELSCVPTTSCASKMYKQNIKRLQAKVAAQRKTIKELLRQPHKSASSTTKALGIIRPYVTEEVFKLLSAQVRLRPKGKGKRFLIWLQKFALHLNFRGPRAYRFLATYFLCPPGVH